MRILFLHHFPLEESAVGELVRQWARALISAGHDARLLIVDTLRRESEPSAIDRVVCSANDPGADLAFDLPRFSGTPEASHGATFHQLSTEHLTQYRDQFRRHLDVQVDRFNPHVLHAQHIWLHGQLAVETGVPYVLNGWGPELSEFDRDERYRAFADQAATNAGRILLPDDEIKRGVERRFELEPHQAIVMPDEMRVGDSSNSAARIAAAEALVRLYQALLDERFGPAV